VLFHLQNQLMLENTVKYLRIAHVIIVNVYQSITLGKNRQQNLGLARTESIISFKEVFKRQIPIIEEDND
jgi:Lrp/AsnC family transcriptional regulator for asnA, asnC and gidA